MAWDLACAGPALVSVDLEQVIESGSLERGPARESWEKLRTGPVAVLRNHYSTYYFTSLAACFLTFAQRSLCASAIRLRASLLKVRPVFLSFFPLA